MLPLITFMISIAVPLGRMVAPLHGGQPGLDDWLAVLAVPFGLAVLVGLAVYTTKKQLPAPPDESSREHSL